MKTYLSIFVVFAFFGWGCQESGSSEDSRQDNTPSIAPREATDPVPAPPHSPDTSNRSAPQKKVISNNKELYRITGTEPFWSLTIGDVISVYRSMSGDSLAYAYAAPKRIEGRPAEWGQLFMLGDKHWVLLRKGNTSCSDGMSDKAYAYTATLWLNGQLLDGCGEQL